MSAGATAGATETGTTTGDIATGTATIAAVTGGGAGITTMTAAIGGAAAMAINLERSRAIVRTVTITTTGSARTMNVVADAATFARRAAGCVSAGAGNV